MRACRVGLWVSDKGELLRWRGGGRACGVVGGGLSERMRVGWCGNENESEGEGEG